MVPALSGGGWSPSLGWLRFYPGPFWGAGGHDLFLEGVGVSFGGVPHPWAGCPPADPYPAGSAGRWPLRPTSRCAVTTRPLPTPHPPSRPCSRKPPAWPPASPGPCQVRGGKLELTREEGGRMKGSLGEELRDGRSGFLWEEGSLGSGGPRRLGSFGRSGPWEGDTEHLGLARHLDAQVPCRVMVDPQGCSSGVPPADTSVPQESSRCPWSPLPCQPLFHPSE